MGRWDWRAIGQNDGRVDFAFGDDFDKFAIAAFFGGRGNDGAGCSFGFMNCWDV